jgi:hypothetical protein
MQGFLLLDRRVEGKEGSVGRDKMQGSLFLDMRVEWTECRVPFTWIEE